MIGPIRSMASGLLRGFARGAARARGRSPRVILTYHGVGEAPGEVPAAVFEAQILRAREAGFVFVSAGRMADWVLGRRPLPGRAVCLTFDDGLASTARTAAPILRRHEVPATLFPVASFLGGPRRFGSMRAQALLDEDDGDPRTVPYDYMTWDELDEWVEAGGEIGGHTMTHPALGQADEASGRAEVGECRELLTKRYGRAPAVFCYPFGDHSGSAPRWVREAGYLAAVTTLPGAVTRGADPCLLPRLPAPRSSGAEFDDLLFGVFRYRRAIRRVVGGAWA